MTKKMQRSSEAKTESNIPRCGLCGKTEKLTKTPCCGNWICDDENISLLQKSCYRNHKHFTLCGFHYNEKHMGTWQECKLCAELFEMEIYKKLGTNDYNFEKLKKLPGDETIKCSQCNKIINLKEGGYSIRGKDYFCGECTEKDFENEMTELLKNQSE